MKAMVLMPLPVAVATAAHGKRKRMRRLGKPLHFSTLLT
jgi:hypothetical protein